VIALEPEQREKTDYPISSYKRRIPIIEKRKECKYLLNDFDFTDIVVLYGNKHAGHNFSPSELAELMHPDVPWTTSERAFKHLEKIGCIERSSYSREERYVITEEGVKKAKEIIKHVDECIEFIEELK